MTPAERQAEELERLQKNADKPIHIPTGIKEKTLRAPRDTMKSVSGSSAGAGSGEFHVYKHARRREFERIKLMEEEAAKVRTACRSIEGTQERRNADHHPSHISLFSTQEKSTSQFHLSHAAQAAADEAKTNKNRLKRDKKKAAKQKGKGGKADQQSKPAGEKRKRSEATTVEDDGDKKMKAAPGAVGLTFQRKQRAEDEGAEDGDESQGEDDSDN